jgi:hypothetical protein
LKTPVRFVVQRDRAEAAITSRRGARFEGSAEILQQIGESPRRSARGFANCKATQQAVWGL